MSYDNSNNLVTSHSFPWTNAAAVLGAIRVPIGKRFAAIEDIQVGAGATAIVNTTTAAQTLIGTAATANKFAAQNSNVVGQTVATGAAFGTADVDGRVAAYSPASGAGKGCIDCGAGGDGDAGAALTALKVSTAVGVGGPTGAGVLTITMRWF